LYFINTRRPTDARPSAHGGEQLQPPRSDNHRALVALSITDPDRSTKEQTEVLILNVELLQNADEIRVRRFENAARLVANGSVRALQVGDRVQPTVTSTVWRRDPRRLLILWANNAATGSIRSPA
jgi:hypothetical protein